MPRTLNNEIPNAKTIAAMKEIEQGSDAGNISVDTLATFIASILY